MLLLHGCGDGLLMGCKSMEGLPTTAAQRSAAELAALTAAVGTLRCVRSGCAATFLKYIPVTVLESVGVSGQTIERLGWFGWHSVGHLRRVTRAQLAAQFPEADLLRFPECPVRLRRG